VSDEEIASVAFVPVAELRLDPANPRLPPEMQEPPRGQREIALYINKHYDPLRIAESISEHTFFESEPLIAVRRDDVYVVIEGNRRLTALMGLADESLRRDFSKENAGWARLDSGNGPLSVPVLVVDNPAVVAPLLGFRHISGIEPWDPYAQARYIAQLVDRDGHSLDEVADIVGRPRTEIASKYRDFDILAQADQMGISTKRARKSFGVFNNAMGRRAVRAFIGAPDPRVVDPALFPLDSGAAPQLSTLITLVFGDSHGKGRVITDSRQLGQLANILAEPTGRALRVLQVTNDLQESLDAATDPSDQFTRAVKTAHGRLEKAIGLDPEVVSSSSIGQLGKIVEMATKLLERHGGEIDDLD
jgi:hypothetical protein